MDKSHEKQKWVNLSLEGSSDELVIHAIGSVLAALPDTGFAERFKIDPAYIVRLGQSVDHWAYRGLQGNPFPDMSESDIRHARVHLLSQSPAILERAWSSEARKPDGVPVEVSSLIKKAIEAGAEGMGKRDHKMMNDPFCNALPDSAESTTRSKNSYSPEV